MDDKIKTSDEDWQYIIHTTHSYNVVNFICDIYTFFVLVIRVVSYYIIYICI